MIEVLNHGLVELIDYMGNDNSIVAAARVSYGNDNGGQEGVRNNNLLRYLLRNKHTSPFEHCVFKFHVKAPIFVFRQWHRHRTWSFNEISARYTELPDEFYIPDKDLIGTQSTSSKQARDIDNSQLSEMDKEYVHQYMEAVHRHSYNAYRILLKNYNVPRELARTVLPVATYSRMYATCDLHNILRFLELRLHIHAQYEIRVYAEAILKLIEPIVPETIKAWKEIQGAGHSTS